MKKIFYLSTILLLFCFYSLPSQNVTTKLPPVDDTYTYSDGTIRGMDDILRTYHSTAGGQFRRITYLKFDLRGVSPFVESAKLRLYCSGFAAGGDNAHQFDLYPVLLNSWAEDDVTFLNATEKLGPDQTTVLASYTIEKGLGLAEGWIEISGTALQKIIADSLAKNAPFISFRMREKNVVKNGTAAVVVDFHSKENLSGFAPELVLEQKDVEYLQLSSLTVGGEPLPLFAADLYSYTCKLPYNTTEIPQVNGVAQLGTSVVTIVQASTLNGTLAQRTAKVKVSDGQEELIYSVIFELLPLPIEGRLSDIMVEDQSIDGFNKDNKSYIYYLPYTATVAPNIVPVLMDPLASLEIKPASNMMGTQSERTTLILTTSADGSVKDQYSIEFVVLPELDIFFAIGQSNMAGRAPFSDRKDPIEDVYLLNNSARLEIASNPLNKYSNIRKDLSVQGLGPSYSFALTMKEYLKKPIALVVNAQGGSSITTWYQPGKSNYDASLLRAQNAQRFGKLKGIIWHQGSSDNSAGLVDNFASYRKNLQSMVSNFRKDLNEPELFFVCGELSERAEFDPFSQYVIKPVASYIPFSDYVTTEGTDLLSDNIHFDAPSNIILGERYAQRFIEQVYTNTTLYKPFEPSFTSVFVSDQTMTVANIQQETLVSIYDISGKLLCQHLLPQGSTHKISLSKGIYLVQCKSEIDTQQTKLMIQ